MAIKPAVAFVDLRVWSLALMRSVAKPSQASILRVFETKDQTKAFYNKISRVYDLLSERSEAPMRNAGLDLLNAKAGECVLEIGSGTAHSLVSLAKTVGPKGKVFGLDLSEGMLAESKKKLIQAGLPRACPAPLR